VKGTPTEAEEVKVKQAFAIGNFEGYDFSHVASLEGDADQLSDCIMVYPTGETYLHLIRTECGIQYELIITEQADAWSVRYISLGNGLDLEQLFWSFGGHNPVLNQIKCIMNGEEQVLVHTS
jgi:hypothetical protein